MLMIPAGRGGTGRRVRISACLFLGTLVAANPSPAYAKAVSYSFRGLVARSELIVEGTVESQEDINQAIPIHGPEHYRKKSSFRISEVHKGKVEPGAIISVLSHRTFICDTCRLKQGERYLLFLMAKDDAYIDVASGQGTRRLAERDGEPLILSHHGLTPEEEFLEDFLRDLEWMMARPTSRPAAPALSADQAVDIARNELTTLGVDLTGWQLVRKERLNIYKDLVGVAYRGEPVWRVEWARPEWADQHPRPRDSVVGAYVHTQTGGWETMKRRRSTALGVCQMFLKTHPPYFGRFGPLADQATITPLPKQEFRNQFSRSRDGYFNPASRGARAGLFIRLDFPQHPDAGSVLFALARDLRVAFAGVLGPADGETRPPDSQPAAGAASSRPAMGPAPAP